MKREEFEMIMDVDFDPLFYILDKGLCRIMLVKTHDKYEYNGLWVKRGKGFTDRHYATLGKSSLEEYVTNYDFTNSKEEAFSFWCTNVVGKTPMTTEQMQHLNQNQDFHY